MTTVRASVLWVATAVLLGTLVGGCVTAPGPSTGPTSTATTSTGSRTSDSGTTSRAPTTPRPSPGVGGGSPVLGVDLTEGADMATRLVDAEEDLARVCPTPGCVRIDVTVDRGPDEDVSESCEVLKIDHPKPLRAGDRVTITINRPCDQEEPDPPTSTATRTTTR